MVGSKAIPTTPEPLNRAPMKPANSEPWVPAPCSWLRLGRMSMDSGEIAPIRSGYEGSIPSSITPTTMPRSLAGFPGWPDIGPLQAPVRIVLQTCSQGDGGPRRWGRSSGRRRWRRWVWRRQGRGRYPSGVAVASAVPPQAQATAIRPEPMTARTVAKTRNRPTLRPRPLGRASFP